jgi:hypothetical protein
MTSGNVRAQWNVSIPISLHLILNLSCMLFFQEITLMISNCYKGRQWHFPMFWSFQTFRVHSVPNYVSNKEGLLAKALPTVIWHHYVDWRHLIQDKLAMQLPRVTHVTFMQVSKYLTSVLRFRGRKPQVSIADHPLSVVRLQICKVAQTF